MSGTPAASAAAPAEDGDTQARLIVDEATISSPSHVFSISCFRRMDARLATKYHPSGNSGKSSMLFFVRIA